MDTVTPLTNEEVARYINVINYQLNNSLVEFKKNFENKLDTISSSLKEQTNILSGISSNVSNMGVDIASIKTGGATSAQIDGAITSICNLKNSLSTIGSVISSVNSAINSIDSNIADLAANQQNNVIDGFVGGFKFISKLSDQEKYNWRERANAKVRGLSSLSGLAHQDAYNKVYDTMKKISGINIYTLKGKNKNISAIRLISNSDVLMDYFRQAIQHLMAMFAIDSHERDFNSVDAMKCPELIKELAARLARKKAANNYDIVKLYKLFNSHENLEYVVNTTKKETNYKNVNKGFAILYSTDGYKRLSNMVDEELKNNS